MRSNQNPKSLYRNKFGAYISITETWKHRVSLLESSNPNQSIPGSPKSNSDEQNHETFLSVIDCIDFQKWYVFVTTLVKDFKLLPYLIAELIQIAFKKV